MPTILKITNSQFSILNSQFNFRTFVAAFSYLCIRSLMDRITDSGSVGHGSIPCGCTLNATHGVRA